MPRFGFRGFAGASTVAMTISQAAASAGATVASWGAQASNAALSIDVWDDADGSAIGAYAAPSSIHLEARPTGFAVSELTALPPLDEPWDSTESNVHDPAFHEIHYFWTVTRPAGSSSTFSNSLNLPNIWNNRNVAYGKNVAFVMDVPGTYTFECFAVDENGATAVASISRTAIDADSVYPGIQTVCVNPAGDADFSWAPTGAQTFYADGVTYADDMAAIDAAMSAMSSTTVSRRLLFRSGTTYDASARSGNVMGFGQFEERRIYVGIGGGTAHAVFNCGPNTGKVVAASFRSQYYSFTVTGLEARGGWNPDLEIGFAPSAPFGADSCTHNTFHRLKSVGFATCFNVSGGIHDWVAQADQPGRMETIPVIPARVCFSECEGTNWSVFGYYGGAVSPNNLQDWSIYGRFKIGFIAQKLAQSPTAINVQPLTGNGAKPVHNDSGPIRWSYYDDLYFGCCDIFANNGIGGHQSPFRTNNGSIHSTTERKGYSYYNVDRCAFEGGASVLGISNQSPSLPNPRSAINVVLDKILLVGTPWTAEFGVVSPGAMTLRNIMGTIPEAAGNGGIVDNLWNLQIENDPDHQHVRAQKWRGYNNTLVVLRSTLNNAVFEVAQLALMDDLIWENNIRHIPSLGIDGGVTGTTLAGFTPRYRGRNDNWRRFDKTLTSVANGGTFTVDYSEVPATTHEGRAAMGTVNQQYWIDNPTHDFHYIISGAVYQVATGQLVVEEYTSTGIRFRNETGVTLNGTFRVFIDRRGLHPGVDTATETPSNLPLLWTPVSGPPATPAQDQGMFAVDDFLLQERTPPRSRGAVEVEG